MDKNKGNLKSEKSKKWIEDALLKLMETEVFQEITIKEIVNQAGLSRRTFYRNFDSKEEIIESRFEKIWGEYVKNLAMQEDLSMPNITKVFLTVMTKHLDYLILINKHQLLPILEIKVDQLLPPVFMKLKGDKMEMDEETISYFLLFGTGGLMRILIKWLGDENRKSPEEMALLMEKIIKIQNYSIEK